MNRARIWLGGFLLLGVLLGLLGSLVVAWQYIDVDPRIIGLHFLAVNAGYVVAAKYAPRLLNRLSVQAVAMVACGLAVVSLLALAIAAPPMAMGWRYGALALLGLSAGCLGTSLLYATEAYFRRSPAVAVNEAATVFGCGCLIATAVIGGMYFLRPAEIAVAALALIPLLMLFLFAGRGRGEKRLLVPDPAHESERQPLLDLQRIATVLFSLLIFFQCGNEWAVAGWLPLFLVHRYGTNPAIAMSVLALYFVVLMMGRWATQRLLFRLGHRKLLAASVMTAICGAFVLSLAHSVVGAAFGAVVVAIGFAPVYPLLAEQLDDRFAYQPGFYNSRVSIAITGAMSVPWLLGFVDAWFGMRYVMLAPAVGSMAVLLLSLLLLLEAHLMGGKPEEHLAAMDASKGS